MKIPSFKFLLAINSFGIFLVVLRLLITDQPMYFFLWWNLFLAAIPFGIALLIQRYQGIQNNKLLFLSALMVWLLFLPNAPYIITDLLHVSQSRYSYVWYDILMILTFAISGLVFGYQSLRMVSLVVLQKAGVLVQKLFVSMVLFACGFGVYLGRYHRFNSWEIIQEPMNIIGEIAVRFMHPMEHPRTWGMTLMMGIFLHILYYAIPGQIPSKHAD